MLTLLAYGFRYAFTRIRVEAVRRLWPNLIEEDKQQMPKSPGGSSTCGAGFADIYRTAQINAHAQCATSGHAVFGGFYLPEYGEDGRKA